MGLLKFHCDENVHHGIPHGLRLHGLDVTVPAEVRLLEADDREHLAFCLLHGRVLVTQDRDMLALAAQGVHHAGICYWKIGKKSIGYVIQSLITQTEQILSGQL